jgi:glycosyltransferase involved in cell wall biosynthesis
VNKPNIEQTRVMRIIARMNVGGPAVQITGLMRNMSSNEFDQRLFTGFCEENEADYLEGVATDVLATRIPGFGRSVALFDDIKVLIRLIHMIRVFKPHIVHTHTAKAGFLGRIASILSFHPSIRVHTFHGHLLYGYFSGLKKALLITVEKILARYTHQLIAVGAQVQLDLVNAGIGNLTKFKVMPPGLQIGPLLEKTTAKGILGLDAAKVQVAYIGRVTGIKRPDRFLEVVECVNQKNSNIHFFIAGDGDLTKTCETKIEEKNLPVRLLGMQTNIELVLSAADVVLLTSDNEGTPLSLIQAGMAGLPVISTDVGSVSEIVLDEVTGIVTSCRVEDLVTALERLSSDENLRFAMGSQGREFTLKNFGVGRLVRDHENLYKKLMANQAKS